MKAMDGVPACLEVDEYTCSECQGHNRCEDEMNAGFGTYDAEPDDLGGELS